MSGRSLWTPRGARTVSATTPHMPSGTASAGRPVSTPGRGTHGLFADGQWYCDCLPRRPAVLRETRKPGINQGRQFYTCSQDPRRKCTFFLWEDYAGVLGAAGASGARVQRATPRFTYRASMGQRTTPPAERVEERTSMTQVALPTAPTPRSRNSGRLLGRQQRKFTTPTHTGDAWSGEGRVGAMGEEGEAAAAVSGWGRSYGEALEAILATPTRARRRTVPQRGMPNHGITQFFGVVRRASQADGAKQKDGARDTTTAVARPQEGPHTPTQQQQQRRQQAHKEPSDYSDSEFDSEMERALMALADHSADAAARQANNANNTDNVRHGDGYAAMTDAAAMAGEDDGGEQVHVKDEVDDPFCSRPRTRNSSGRHIVVPVLRGQSSRWPADAEPRPLIAAAGPQSTDTNTTPSTSTSTPGGRRRPGLQLASEVYVAQEQAAAVAREASREASRRALERTPRKGSRAASRGASRGADGGVPATPPMPPPRPSLYGGAGAEAGAVGDQGGHDYDQRWEPTSRNTSFGSIFSRRDDHGETGAVNLSQASTASVATTAMTSPPSSCRSDGVGGGGSQRILGSGFGGGDSSSTGKRRRLAYLSSDNEYGGGDGGSDGDDDPLTSTPSKRVRFERGAIAGSGRPRRRALGTGDASQPRQEDGTTDHAVTMTVLQLLADQTVADEVREQVRMVLNESFRERQ